MPVAQGAHVHHLDGSMGHTMKQQEPSAECGLMLAPLHFLVLVRDPHKPLLPMNMRWSKGRLSRGKSTLYRHPGLPGQCPCAAIHTQVT